MLNLTSVGWDFPSLTYKDFSEYFFVPWFRCTPQICPLNYRDMMPTLKYLPSVKSGNCHIHLTFNEKTSDDEVQVMFVLGIQPEILEIDAHRQIKLSYYSS